ncbi:hypothetical protein KBC04_04565 [Candidatus Babeliales bacterium]|nr:hypothetical protein [Candidatus Babeliales bacterium]MBP9844094.1 hypothetical protein [Candidatus Babeliales bacterium]
MKKVHVVIAASVLLALNSAAWGMEQETKPALNRSKNSYDDLRDPNVFEAKTGTWTINNLGEDYKHWGDNRQVRPGKNSSGQWSKFMLQARTPELAQKIKGACDYSELTLSDEAVQYYTTLVPTLTHPEEISIAPQAAGNSCNQVNENQEKGKLSSAPQISPKRPRTYAEVLAGMSFEEISRRASLELLSAVEVAKRNLSKKHRNRIKYREENNKGKKNNK